MRETAVDSSAPFCRNGVEVEPLVGILLRVQGRPKRTRITVKLEDGFLPPETMRRVSEVYSMNLESRVREILRMGMGGFLS